VISVSKGGNMGNLNETPSANRLHIGIYGKTNSGKSSLINAVTKQEVSIVADVAGADNHPRYKPSGGGGTTTRPCKKADGDTSARTVRDY